MQISSRIFTPCFRGVSTGMSLAEATSRHTRLSSDRNNWHVGTQTHPSTGRVHVVWSTREEHDAALQNPGTVRDDWEDLQVARQKDAHLLIRGTVAKFKPGGAVERFLNDRAEKA